MRAVQTTPSGAPNVRGGLAALARQPPGARTRHGAPGVAAGEMADAAAYALGSACTSAGASSTASSRCATCSPRDSAVLMLAAGGH